MLEICIFSWGVYGSGHCSTPPLMVKPLSTTSKDIIAAIVSFTFSTGAWGKEQRKFGGISNDARDERKKQAFEMQRYKSLSRKQIIQWYRRKKRRKG